MARLKSWSRLHVSMRPRDHLTAIPEILSLEKVIHNILNCVQIIFVHVPLLLF